MPVKDAAGEGRSSQRGCALRPDTSVGDGTLSYMGTGDTEPQDYLTEFEESW